MSKMVDDSQFISVAEMRLNQTSNLISVTINDVCEANWTEAIYAWITPTKEVLRFGTSRAPLKRRLRAYQGHINRSLEGKNSPTPSWEAQKWKELLQSFDYLVAIAHQPEEILSVAGMVRPYLDIERALIRQLKPALNRSHR